MAEPTYWVSEHDVVSALSLADAIEALRETFGRQGAGEAAELEKTMLGYGDHATLHALGAAIGGCGLAGVKTWTHTPGGADPVLCMFDTQTGALRAVVEAFALGQMRTSGTSALATDLLARPDSSVLAVVGTGKQALPQVAAVAQVRDLSEVRAFSRSAEHREAFARRVHEELGLAARAAASVEEAVAGADVVTLVTRATEALLTEGMVEEGMHVNALGAIDLDRREFSPAILGRCAAVVTDSLAQAKNLSSELREFYGAGNHDWAGVRSLGAVVADRSYARADADVTVFKGMGSGIEDAALGTAVLERLGLAPTGPFGGTAARVTDLQRVERRGRAEPDLRPATFSSATGGAAPGPDGRS